ncbi:MAG: hypothetical protein CMP11_09675 [Zetaproteobacteria bacterium]|nr:hypothetical protein [Pseudobdellovibrionaceae bacterium]
MFKKFIAPQFFFLLSSLFIPLSSFGIILSPGYMGPQAMPVPEVQDFTVGKDNIISFYLENNIDPGKEYALNPKVKIFSPWGKKAALRLSFVPHEIYYMASDVKKKRETKNQMGNAKGDIYFGSMFELYNQDFGLALNLLTKTTSGKNLKDARHLNAPAYIIDISFGKKWYYNRFFENINISGYVAFIVWQSQFNQQNDALGLALKSAFTLHSNYIFSVEAGAYYGWQKKKDNPVTVRFNLKKRLNISEICIQYSYGIRDQIPYSLIFGVSFFSEPLLARLE